MDTERIPVYTFIPPTVEEGPAGGNYLFARYTLTRGVTVLKVGSDWLEVRFPTQDLIAEASAVYMGGHEYVVTQAERDDLVAAGYTVVQS